MPGEATVLLYHEIDSATVASTQDNAADLSVVVDEADFRQQLRSLAVLGKTVVSLEQVLDSDWSALPEDIVVITFDDGHRSNHSLALPALLDAHAVATFYIVAGFVDERSDYVAAAELREMADHGMLIGSHSMTHRFLPLLDDDDLETELRDSRSHLEDVIGRPVLDLAIPGGHFDRRVLAAARACGYRSVATCEVGLFEREADRFHIPRLEIRRGLSDADFASTFQKATLRRLKMLENGKSLLRRSLGLKRYTRLRGAAHRLINLRR